MSGGRAVYEAINGPAPGKFLETTRGTTHYVLEGPEDAPLLVVLQHGIGGALSLFDRIAADLVTQGCRVLRYEFYDRGYSESDAEKYPVTAVSHTLRFTLDVYVEQCREVLGLPGQDPDAADLGQGRRFRALLAVPDPRADCPRRGDGRVGGRLRRDAAQRVLRGREARGVLEGDLRLRRRVLANF